MNDSSGLDPVLLDLLVEWEERKAAGTSVTPECLCRACPERVEDFRRQVERMGRLDPLLALARETAPPALPGFTLLGEIGRGGMGVVYKARDLRLDRVVAVKVPTGAADGAVRRKRFEREVRALAKLRHPNIVPVHTAGVAGDTPYLVMEYVHGGSLAGRMKEAAGTPARAAALVAQVARAVDHAHAAGIVHRDLKPSNILLDEAGRPFVSDFGIAVLLAGGSLTEAAGDTPDDHEPGQTRMTRSGAAAGTPAYAAPESLPPGGPGRPAAAADVWSLGVVLYECLTGRLPYPEPGSRGDTFLRPPPLPRSIRPQVPRGLEVITLRCLAIDPAGRYPTAAALAADLDRWSGRVRLRRRVRAGGRAGLFTATALGLVVALAWPESPAVRHGDVARGLEAELAGAGRLDLVPSAGLPRTHLVRVNPSIATTGLTDAGLFFVESPRPCLVELLPDVPGDRYRITAELRQETGLFDAEVGLYCGHWESPDGPAPGHRFVFLTFADAGLLAHKYPGPGGRPGSALNLRGFRYHPPDPPEGAWDQAAIRWAWYDPPAAGGEIRGPWRRVSLEVSPDVLHGACDTLELPPGPAHAVAGPVRSPRYPRGGVGVYVSSCKVLVRNCRIELLPNP